LVGVPLPIAGHAEFKAAGKADVDHTDMKEPGDPLDPVMPSMNRAVDSS
jgi:hypothetical protein